MHIYFPSLTTGVKALTKSMIGCRRSENPADRILYSWSLFTHAKSADVDMVYLNPCAINDYGIVDAFYSWDLAEDIETLWLAYGDIVFTKAATALIVMNILVLMRLINEYFPVMKDEAPESLVRAMRTFIPVLVTVMYAHKVEKMKKMVEEVQETLFQYLFRLCRKLVSVDDVTRWAKQDMNKVAGKKNKKHRR